jgi:hypothetical protein
METLTIQVNNSKALQLLQDLEALNLIKVIRRAGTATGKKLSAALSGSLSKEQADKMLEELKQMRNEWEKDSY